MRASDKPSVVTASHPSRADGDEVPQPMQSPQSIPSGQSNGVCPSPTSLPFIANDSCWIHADYEYKWLPPPSCDHGNCKPPDVGFLSRRFMENEDWIRARASAAASITHKRGGGKSLLKSVQPATTKLTAVLWCSLLITSRSHYDDPISLSSHRSLDHLGCLLGFLANLEPLHGIQDTGCHL